MTTADIKAAAKVFAEECKMKQYSQERQCSFIVVMLRKIIPELHADAEMRIKVIALLNEHGLGANNSQFNKWVFGPKVQEDEEQDEALRRALE